MKTIGHSRVFKYYVLMTLIVLLMCFTTGCASSKISRNEAMQYVENYLGIDNYSIDRFSHTNEYSGYAYTVYDKDADIEFDVYGVVGLTGDVVLSFSRGIYDNYALKYLDKINGTLPQTFKYYGNGDNRELISYYGGYVITYSNRAELDEACEKRWMINNALEGKTRDSIPFKFEYVGPDFGGKDVLLSYVMDSSFSEYSGHLFEADYDDDDYVQSLSGLKEEVERNYFTLGYIYNYPDILADLGDDKIEDFADYRAVDVYVVYDIDAAIEARRENVFNKDEFSRLSDNCVAYMSENHAYRLTYGNLYTLLINEGFDVSGDSEDFVVITDDGTNYEFANSFIDTSKLYRRSYYLRDGEMVYTNLDEDIAVGHDLVLELFGIYVDYDHFPCLQRDDSEKNTVGEEK
jgi:hypothetical protein